MGKNIARCEIYKLVAISYSIFEVSHMLAALNRLTVDQIQLVDPTKEWKIKETVLGKQEGLEAKISLRPGAILDQLLQGDKHIQANN